MNKKYLLIAIASIILVIILIIVFWLVFRGSKDGASKLEDILFTKQCIEIHDQLRKKHNAPTVSLNPELVAYAATRASKLAELDRLEHLPDEFGYGENLFYTHGATYDCYQVTKDWYNEFKEYNFDFNNPKWSFQTGHATQVVWAGSTEIGCAQRSIMQNSRPKQYTVCLYKPPGNFIGKFKENVFPPTS